MEIKPVVLVLADISGYTRFIRYHRASLIHAECIISDLLESVIGESKRPLILHELEGDAAFFYAESDGTPETARDICAQVERFLEAFRERERELISECGLCKCEACASVGQLRLKVVVHHGKAVFTQIRQFTKVAGEDVILAHRLLKNSIDRDEYVLLTAPFHALSGRYTDCPSERRIEHCEGLGDAEVFVYYPGTSPDDLKPAPRSLKDKLGTFLQMERYLVKRLFRPAPRRYRHLEHL